MLKDLFVGINVPPAVVGQARGFLLAVILAAIGAAIVYVGNVDFTVLGLPQGISVLIGPAILYILRGAEAIVDQWQTPNQNDVPPPKTPVTKKAGA